MSRYLAAAVGLLALVGCGGGETVQPVAPIPEGPLPSLIVAQAHFKTIGGKTTPQPAKLTLWKKAGDRWLTEVITDPESNVFHKAIAWNDGLLTISGDKAQVKHWTRSEDGWTARLLKESNWGGKFNRYRDVEVGDLTGDGVDELVFATHDKGVISIASLKGDALEFVEMPQKDNTFVHEIEIGDVDGDGKMEFYATPSDRNRASGESQPGSVVRVDYVDGEWTQSPVIQWENSHAKEILVAKIAGKDRLYAVREGHTTKRLKEVTLVDPVRIVELTRTDSGWASTEIATLNDFQCRFLVPGDVNGDGYVDLIAAGMQSGLWFLKGDGKGGFSPELIDKKSSGYEHATHVADLDGDGALEIYVASDDQLELRQYTWNGTGFSRKRVGGIAKGHLTWNIQDGVF